MLPVIFAPDLAPLALIGNGIATHRRLGLIDAAGLACRVFAPTPIDALARAARGRLVRSLPDSAALESAPLVFIADTDDPLFDSTTLDRLTAVSRLVNVEDVPSRCNFHVPAVVRRGDLLLTVSTGGASPRLAQRVRQWLERRFSSAWAGRVRALAGERSRWRAEGLSSGTLVTRSDHYIDERKWLI